ALSPGTLSPPSGSLQGPDTPLLLSPMPGPSQRKQVQSRSERASRPGLSRIPGRDHRRYYHEYWRSEYLMDFDPRRHGMICMVCGSSLATLKLSTIKRHIRQKHPDSLLWSTADKEVIRSGWESHLGLEGSRQPRSASGDEGPEEVLDCARRSTGVLSHLSSATPPPCLEGKEAADPPVHTLERYLNDSLHAWFRQEFLMEYEAEAGRLVCMVCGSQLPSLHLDHIKSHVLDIHPNSLVYSAEEKHCILQTWAQSAEEATGEIFLQDTASGLAGCGKRRESSSRTLDVSETPKRKATQLRLRNRLPRDSSARVWRMDYLVAYGPDGRGAICMVCSQTLPTTRVGRFRRHIQDCHPETANLSRREREALAQAWAKETAATARGTALQEKEEAALCIEAAGAGQGPGGTPKEGTPGRHGHYPGKDQRRNYQVRWRMEYLMDYDCRRHGLICMVCGAALATLKVSTIKRHIQQVHPHSMEFGPEERQQALLSYNQTALHFVHSEDCFSALDHGSMGQPVPTGQLGQPALFAS
uniref:Zinc finger translocation associated n=1 Tax=Scleropages formosus TaxID=113540 RepID=A0A8C9V6J9_SCLFO